MVIYMDMDGVLCDFIYGFEHRFGIKYNKDKYGYNLVEQLRVEKGVDSVHLWDILGVTFWSQLPELPMARVLLDMCDYVCTTLPPSGKEAAMIGKMEWMKERSYGKPIITIEDKYRLAQPGTLLVDDNEYGVSRFIEHGGKAILYRGGTKDDDHIVDTIRRKCSGCA